VKRISVVIPALNAAGTIGEAIASLRSERDLIEEVLVIDDGSVDDTGSIAMRAGRDCGLPLSVRTVQKRGPGAARNAGFAASSTAWIYFLDADDIHLEGGLRRLIEQADLEPEAGVVIGPYVRREQGTDRVIAASSEYSRAAVSQAEDFLADRMEAINVGFALISRHAMADVRFPEAIWYEEDTLFWARLLRRAVVAKIDAPVMRYNRSRKRSDDRLAVTPAASFFAWRRALRELLHIGVDETVLRMREGLMAIKIARVHYVRGDLRTAARFLRLARSSPKDLATAWRYWRYRIKVGLKACHQLWFGA